MKRRKSPGFTLVELLIVIVIIAILAAITIIAYNGITSRARATVLQSDLSQAATTLGAANATNGSYPADQTSAGLKASSGDTLTYNVSSDGKAYCLTGTGYGMAYSITSDNQVPQVGLCNGGFVTTLAGGTQGSTNGTGTAAKFNYPSAITLDASGNVYVADSDNNCIRKITPAAIVTSFAGTCASDNSTKGAANGTGSAAQFNGPFGVAFDSSGNLYVGDSFNNCIRKISPAAVVTTFAGTCASDGSTSGFANGTGSAAQFADPIGVAADSTGNVYVADYNSNCIRKITPATVVSTLAGTCASDGSTWGFADGTGAAAKFQGPFNLDTDSSGIVYVADQNNSCIRKITPAGVATTFAGTCAANGSTFGFTDGTGAAAKFANPTDVAVDTTGNVYVADDSSNCIRKITPATVVTTLAGVCASDFSTHGFADGTGAAAKFNNPTGVAVDSSGTVYVADPSNNRIRVIK